MQESKKFDFPFQNILNELYFRISRDHAFLLDAYKDVIKGDPYIKRCVEIADQVISMGSIPVGKSFSG